jgi:hypothetical protein
MALSLFLLSRCPWHRGQKCLPFTSVSCSVLETRITHYRSSSGGGPVGAKTMSAFTARPFLWLLTRLLPVLRASPRCVPMIWSSSFSASQAPLAPASLARQISSRATRWPRVCGSCGVSSKHRVRRIGWYVSSHDSFLGPPSPFSTTGRSVARKRRPLDYPWRRLRTPGSVDAPSGITAMVGAEPSRANAACKASSGRSKGWNPIERTRSGGRSETM